jgi:hypothetical protein
MTGERVVMQSDAEPSSMKLQTSGALSLISAFCHERAPLSPCYGADQPP